MSIQKDILLTTKNIAQHATYLGTNSQLQQVIKFAKSKTNDAKLLLKLHRKLKSLPKVVKEQSKLWFG